MENAPKETNVQELIAEALAKFRDLEQVANTVTESLTACTERLRGARHVAEVPLVREMLSNLKAAFASLDHARALAEQSLETVFVDIETPAEVRLQVLKTRQAVAKWSHATNALTALGEAVESRPVDRLKPTQAAAFIRNTPPDGWPSGQGS